MAVLEVNRDKIRNLGITLPTSFGLTPQASNCNVRRTPARHVTTTTTGARATTAPTGSR